MFKCILLFVVSGVAGLLVTSPLFAQDYIPQVVTVSAAQVQASTCYTMEPIPIQSEVITASQTVTPRLWLPLVPGTLPQCTELGDWQGSIALLSGNKALVPNVNAAGKLDISKTNFPFQTKPLTLTTDYWSSDDVISVTKGAKEIKIFAIRYTNVEAAQTGPPPDGPVNLEEVRWGNRAGPLNRGMQRGTFDRNVTIPATTPLYDNDNPFGVSLTIAGTCPAVMIPTIDVIFVRSYFSHWGGAYTAWVEIQHTQVTQALCPNISTWRFVKLAQFWDNLQLAEKVAVDSVVVAKTQNMLPIVIQMTPEESGPLIPREMLAKALTYAGSVTVVYITIEAIKDYWYVMVLVP